MCDLSDGLSPGSPVPPRDFEGYSPESSKVWVLEQVGRQNPLSGVSSGYLNDSFLVFEVILKTLWHICSKGLKNDSILDGWESDDSQYKTL